MTTDLSKSSQVALIKKQLELDGEVSRNWCLQRYITRLGARIWDLKQEGYEFEIERRGKDYVYVLVTKPKTRAVSDVLGTVNASMQPSKTASVDGSTLVVLRGEINEIVLVP